MAHDDVEFVAMNDEVALTVGRGMDRLPLDLDPAEGQPEELAGEFVVVARNKDHPRAAPNLAQQFLDDVVMRLRPVPAGAEPPAVDDVADQVDRVGLDMAQHIQDKMRLGTRACPGASPTGRASCIDGVVGTWAPGASSRGGEQREMTAQILMSLR